MLRRREWRGWEFAALAVAVGAVAAALAKAWPTAVAVSAGTAAASATAAVLISRAKASWDRRSRENSQLERHLLTGVSGLVLRVRDVNNPVVLGVHPAGSLPGGGHEASSLGRVPAFVPRELMIPLQRALLTDRFVLLIGDSTAGKSRAAYEAIRLLPDHRLVFPRDREGLPAATRAILSQRRSILWLNDLDRFLGPGGLDAHTVQRLLGSKRDVIIVASMRAQEHAKYLTAYSLQAEETGVGPLVAGPDVLQAGRDVIDLAAVIRVERQWSAVDLAAAREYSDDPRIADAVAHADRFGVAEYLAAAPQLHSAWQDAWAPGGSPRGAALVAAAVVSRDIGTSLWADI
jgi:eukaryotic-like serine/threonine-protein kinase